MGDSSRCENHSNRSEEVTGCCIRAENTRKPSLAALRFNFKNLFHSAGCGFVNLDSVPWLKPDKDHRGGVPRGYQGKLPPDAR